MNGYIKLHRKIMEWEWYDDPTVMRTFLHLLLKANHREKIWRGIQVQPGQLITSYAHLSQETGLSKQQVRTALDKLESTQEITRKATNKYTTINVLNWGTYQEDEPASNTQTTRTATIKQQSNNIQITTNKNDKNVKNEKNLYKTIVDFLNETAGTSYRSSSKKTQTLINARINDGFKLEDFKQVIQTKTADWKDNEKMHRYIRPETLFSPKFESYLNEKPQKPKEGIDWFQKYKEERT